MQKIKNLKSVVIATIMSLVLALGCVGAILNQNGVRALADDEKPYLRVDNQLKSVTWNLGDESQYWIYFDCKVNLPQGNGGVYAYEVALQTDNGELRTKVICGTDLSNVIAFFFDITAWNTVNPNRITIPAGTKLNASDTYTGDEYAGIEFVNDFVIVYDAKATPVQWFIKDTIAPVITWSDGDELVLEEGYDASTITASATDDKDGTVECTYSWSDGALDVEGCLVRGTHTLTIEASDVAGNKATKVVTVIVNGEDLPETPDDNSSSSSSSSSTSEPDSSSSSVVDSNSSSNGGEQSSSSSCKGSTSVSTVLIVSLVAVVCFVIKSKKQTR